MTKSSLSVICMSLLVVVGCSSSNNSSSPTVAGQAFTKAQAALESTGTLMNNSASSLAARAFDDHCTGMGSGNNESADYIACILTNNDGSPETAQGAMTLVKEILEGVESRVALTYPEDARTTENITFTVDTSDGQFTVTASVKDRAGDGAPWTHHVDVCIHKLVDANSQEQVVAPDIEHCENNTYGVSISIKKTSTAVAFKNVVRFGGDYELSAFHLDSETDTMRFESFSLGNGNHTRAYVQGSVSANLVLDDISTAEFASAYYEDQGMGNYNWGALYAQYDGAALCMNYQQDQNPQVNNQDLDQGIGTCNSHPNYNVSFHDFTTGGFETWADDSTKGLLQYTEASFAVGSFFINQ